MNQFFFRNESDRMAYLGDAYRQAADCAKRIDALTAQDQTNPLVSMTLDSERAEAARLDAEIASAEAAPLR